MMDTIIYWTIEANIDDLDTRKLFYSSIYDKDLVQSAFWKKDIIGFVENTLGIKKYTLYFDHLLFKFELYDEKLYKDVKNKEGLYNKIKNYTTGRFATRNIEFN